MLYNSGTTTNQLSSTHRLQVELWDITTRQKVRTFLGHIARVCAQSWNSHLLSTGGADSMILHRDIRVPEHSVTRLLGHRGQVAVLKVIFSMQSCIAVTVRLLLCTCFLEILLVRIMSC